MGLRLGLYLSNNAREVWYMANIPRLKAVLRHDAAHWPLLAVIVNKNLLNKITIYIYHKHPRCLIAL